jgi:hypothetical protein
MWEMKIKHDYKRYLDKCLEVKLSAITGLAKEIEGMV